MLVTNREHAYRRIENKWKMYTRKKHVKDQDVSLHRIYSSSTAKLSPAKLSPAKLFPAKLSCQNQYQDLLSVGEVLKIHETKIKLY